MKFILAGMILLASLAVRASDDPAQGELRSLLDAFLAGASANDAAMHDRFWAEDLVYTSSAGARFGKAEIMQGLAAASDTTEAVATPTYSARDAQIQVIGDAAVITFRLVATDAHGSETHYFNTGVFRRHSDQWRAVAWQATRAID